MRANLGSIAIGAGLISLAWLGSLLVWKNPDPSLVLEYVQPASQRPPPPSILAADLGKDYDSASGYLVAASAQCKLKSWTLVGLDYSDAPSKGALLLDEGTLSDDQFDCLADLAKPPFVHLRRRANGDTRYWEYWGSFNLG